MNDDTPIVTVNWIAQRLGITPGRVRRYIPSNGPEPRMPDPIRGLSEYAWMRADAEAWIEAYKAAPKRGRRGDGSVRRKYRKQIK